MVFVYPIPEAGWNVPEELARRRERAGEPVTLTTDAARPCPGAGGGERQS